MKIFCVIVVTTILLPLAVAQQSQSILVKEGETLSILDWGRQPTDSSASGIEVNGFTGVYKPQDNTDDAEKIHFTYFPHPYLTFGASLMPAGYATLAGYLQGGLEIEGRDVVLDLSAIYDNGHKTNDNDQPNNKGHDRYLRGVAYWRLSALSRPKWLVGGGYRWSQLSTTNYTKGGSRPQFGGGYDLYFDRRGTENACASCWFSARFMVNWVMAGTDRQNGSHGPEFSMVMPRPVEKRHLFVTYTLGIYRFHTTVTEPENAELTKQQLAQKFTYGTYSLGLMYRFW
jgi:hypothetical protein